MLGLKIKTALQASILFAFGFWLLFFLSEGGLFSVFLIMIFFYCFFGNVIYGVPVSLLSECFTKNLAIWRFHAAAFIHTFLLLSLILLWRGLLFTY